MGESCWNQSIGSGLADLAPSVEDVYYFIGAIGADTSKVRGRAEWLSVAVTNMILFSAFYDSPCNDFHVWSCLKSGFIAVNEASLTFRGTNGGRSTAPSATSYETNYILYLQAFSSDCNFRIEASLDKNDSENYHVIYVSTSAAGPWSNAHADDRQLIGILPSDDNPYLLGPITNASAGCDTSMNGTYTIQLTITSNSTWLDVTIEQAAGSTTCSVTLSEGLADFAPSGEDVYFYLGAEAAPGVQTAWNSIRVDACPSDVRAPHCRTDDAPPDTVAEPIANAHSEYYTELRAELCAQLCAQLRTERRADRRYAHTSTDNSTDA